MSSTNASPTGGLLPHHLSQVTFRFYEPYLTLAVANFPDETSWDISTLRANDPSIKIGPVTFAARFRDAIVSLIRFRWDINTPQGSTVDYRKLREIAGKYAIAQQPGTSNVWFRNRANKGRPSSYIAEARVENASAASSPGPVLWKDATDLELAALCLLLGNGKVTGVYLCQTRFSDEVITSLTANHNVSITWDEEQKRTVIT